MGYNIGTKDVHNHISKRSQQRTKKTLPQIYENNGEQVLNQTGRLYDTRLGILK